MGLLIMSFAIFLISFSCLVNSEGTILQNTQGCVPHCGNIIVNYPFGLEDRCCLPGFKLFCDRTSSHHSLWLRVSDGKNIKVVGISLKGTVVVEMNICHTCYNNQLAETSSFKLNMSIKGTPFTFSTKNFFYAIGCDTVGWSTERDYSKFTGCACFCESKGNMSFKEEVLSTCSGLGCCQTKVPKNVSTLVFDLFSLYKHNYVLGVNPCSYAFLADPAWYRNITSSFNISHTPEKQKYKYSHVILDWAVGDKPCEEAERSPQYPNDYICGENTWCRNPSNGQGYRCACKDGYQGNPYMGFEDVNECNKTHKPCQFGTCKNTAGYYRCICPFGKHGGGEVTCSINTGVKVLIGIGLSLLLATTVLFLAWAHKKRVDDVQNHHRNGGLLLENLSVRSFKRVQLEKATNNFDSQNILGQGGNGCVYRGSIDGMIDIAVKKSKVVDQNKIEQFLNEADIVSKINHINVVKLLGVCLDSKVPMLVYQFVPNGTLYEHIHGSKSRILDSWRICLRIAAEAARALDYMHSLAFPPIIHRDVKSSNILLDETYTAKVADFGASKLIPPDRTIAPTEGQGTMGYFDPEYLQTGELTTKSDVYSFGVVLMELLSKEKPLSRGNSGETISLVKVFTSAVEDNQLNQVLKMTVTTAHELEGIQVVAKLAVKCVAMLSKDRPTMTEVADVLHDLSKEYHTSQVEGSGEELVGLLDDQEDLTTSVHFEISYSSNDASSSHH